jgi:hypothetical protein
MSQYTFNQINDLTAFADAMTFKSESQLRNYFTLETLAYMFQRNVDDIDQSVLDEMAEIVLANKWHCNF